MLKVIRELSERQVLIEQDGKNYLVSQSIEEIQPVETLVFKCDIEGNVSDWGEVGGEVGVGINTFLKRCLEEDKIIMPWLNQEQDDLPW